ncbi:acyl-CoA N-acyltransferase [Lophiotrema nucula]|uniref:Acyl-CoA N-acyltransferase n=1 Tax=Lophiotrema nucula TaxID=690887 RepID=A0A6A5ZRP3_9PLEO|nr:acyl-CoA N-acyltransferase [Lophiotrema nucula]
MSAGTTPAHPAIMTDQIQAGAAVPADSPIPTPIVQTSRLILRAMHSPDAPTLQKLCAPFEITKYMSLAFAHPYTLQHAETWVAMQVANPGQAYVICLKESPERVIGGIGIKPGSDVQAHCAEVGYWIGIPYWGKAYTTEALRAFTSYIYTERHDTYRRLFAGVFEGNDGSMKCLERCGYVKEGIFKGHVEKHGQTLDLHMFGLTRTDWEESWTGKEVRRWNEEDKVWIWA